MSKQPLRNTHRSRHALIEHLEPRVVMAVDPLSALHGAPFLVVRDAVADGRHVDVARIDLGDSAISAVRGRGVAVRAVARADDGEVLPLRLLGSDGELLPQARQHDGAVVGLAWPRQSFRAVVRDDPGSSYRVLVSLAGDINGDHEVDVFDDVLHNARHGHLAGLSEVALRRLDRHVAANQGVSITRDDHDVSLGVRLVFDNDHQHSDLGSTELTTSDGSWHLRVGGKPFYAKGATGDVGYADAQEWTYDYMNEDFDRSGANVFRTYGLGDIAQQNANTSAALAWAARNSTTAKPVMILVGLYVPGVSTDQLKASVDAISADPNASHILGWCVGNETDQSTYAQINTVAAYIKTKSTAPVMTAVPIVNTGALQNINATMPNLDWLGINTFYGKFDASHVQDLFLGQLDATMSNGTWTKPWAVTEYYSYDLPSPAFPGYAGMPSQTLNGTPYYLELNSTANAQNYADSFSDYIFSQRTKNNVGGFALNWIPPHNSQVPAYWKDMFAYRGAWQIFVNPYGSGTDRLEAVDAVTTVYGGTAPANATPQIVVTDGDPQGIVAPFKATITSTGTKVSAGQSLTASVTADDADALTYDWYLIGGTTVTTPTSPGIIGGPSTNPFEVYGSNAVTSVLVGHGTTSRATGSNRQVNTLTFAMPAVPAGNVYQLRVIVRDGQGGAATAAVGFAT